MSLRGDSDRCSRARSKAFFGNRFPCHRMLTADSLFYRAKRSQRVAIYLPEWGSTYFSV